MTDAHNAPKAVRDLLFYLGSRPDVETHDFGDGNWIVSVPVSHNDALEADFDCLHGTFSIWRRKWAMDHGLSREDEIGNPRDTEECALFMKAELARIEEEFKRMESYFPKEDDEEA